MRLPLFKVPRWVLVAVWPIAVVVLMLASWAVDTAAHAGVVPRNVTVAGRTVSGLADDDLHRRVGEIAAQFSATPVTVETAAGPQYVTIADLGVEVDIEATVAAVESTVSRDPLAWLGALLDGRSTDLVLSVDEQQAVALLSTLPTVRTPLTEPHLDGSGGALVLVEGTAGQVLDVEAMVEMIPSSVDSRGASLRLEAMWTDLEPTLHLDDLEGVAAEAESIVNSGVRLRVNDFVAPLPAATAATWFSSALDDDGQPALVVDRGKALDDIRALMAPGDIGGSDEAVYDIVEGEVVVTATESARVCCEEHAVSVLIGNARSRPAEPVDLPVRAFTPSQVLEEAEKLGIIEEVASFTTNHPAGQSRVVNIQLFADLMRGHVIKPGETASLNEIVGKRTVEKGFVGGGFISGGVLKTDIGGGVSQVATTTFNTAFFAGLDFADYRAHSIYFNRYPYGREATISWPAPDLVLENNTPYGVLIWTSYTDTSITVSMYSTKHLDAYQTDQRTTFQDQCRRVSTERTRIYHHGEATIDSFWALYRPDEGFNCDGSPSDPSVTTVPPTAVPPATAAASEGAGDS